MQRRRPTHVRTVARLLVAAAAVGGLVAACAVPSSSGTPPTPSALPSGPSRPFRPTPAPAPTFSTYTVRRGDTLIALATRFATTPESIAYWNRAQYPSLDPETPSYRPEKIEVGWQLAYLPGEVVDPENLPGASAAPSDGAADATIGPYPTLPPDGSAALVRRGPAGLAGVALTFDEPGGPGAGPEGADAIVQWLEVNGVPATVFVAPAAATPGDPGAAVLARLAGADGVRAGLLADVETADGLGDSLTAADQALATALGTSTAPWLRPANGIVGPDGLAEAGRAGWTWAIAWDVDPGDDVGQDVGGPTAGDIVTRVVSRAEGGSIIRLRLNGARTLEALPGIVDGLASVGLRIVPLDELLGVSGEE